LLIGNSRMMLKYPEEESRLVAVIQPFTLLVNLGRQNDFFFFFTLINKLFYTDLGEFVDYFLRYDWNIGRFYPVST
jgi:hypothetical protein